MAEKIEYKGRRITFEKTRQGMYFIEVHQKEGDCPIYESLEEKASCQDSCKGTYMTFMYSPAEDIASIEGMLTKDVISLYKDKLEKNCLTADLVKHLMDEKYPSISVEKRDHKNVIIHKKKVTKRYHNHEVIDYVEDIIGEKSECKFIPCVFPYSMHPDVVTYESFIRKDLKEIIMQSNIIPFPKQIQN